MKPYQYFWQLIRYRPRWYFADVISFTLHATASVALGLILRGYFNYLTGEAGIQLTLGPTIAAQVGYRLLLGSMLATAALAWVNFQFRVMALLIRNMFARLLEMPAAQPLPLKADGTRLSSGEAISTLRDDSRLLTVAMVLIDDVTGYGLTALISFVIMLRINVLVTIGTFVPLAIVIYIANRLGQLAKQYRAASREATSQVTGIIADIFNNTQAIKVAHAEERVIAHFRQVNDARREAMVKDKLLEKLIDALSSGTIDVGMGFILLLAAQAMFAGTFTIGDFALFAAYIWPVTQMMRLTGHVITQYKQASVATTRMETMMQGLPTGAVVVHHDIYEDGNVPPIPPLTTDKHDQLHHLQVRGLSYYYTDNTVGIDNINLDIPRGSLTVITGRIGSGKTTLLQVLLGLLPADAGTITWNDTLVTNPATFLMPPRVAYTGQVPRLFSDTLRRNILLGLSEEVVDLPAALHTAVMNQDTAAMDEGLDTQVGPRGIRLSGGQIQRSAAARMFVRPAELFIFDDLSSALDVETERHLWQQLWGQRRAGIAFLVVSHRKRVWQQADQIIVLREGKIVDAGKLDELLERCQEMRILWQGE